MLYQKDMPVITWLITEFVTAPRGEVKGISRAHMVQGILPIDIAPSPTITSSEGSFPNRLLILSVTVSP
jgi:hypothetical protein